MKTSLAIEAFTREEVEAAICLWEAMLDLRPKLPALDQQFEQNGSWAMRSCAIDLVKHCEQVWSALTNNGEDDRCTYDWEYIPAYVALWTEHGQLPVTDCVAKLRNDALASVFRS